MHIKQVTICGFRSFKDQVVVEPFSEKHNVVIGRNGTGKSNFFDAIRFGLLTSRFSNLRQEERQSLLHEGSGKHVLSAYVEIIFDNSDGRLPIDTEQVVLRRTIGVKKDEFFLNRKHIPKADVIHLLESAGFSRSNPYYIVQQGKVNALALMKDKDRLELLKEVAGTKVYEDRRVESLKIMHETESRREKIQQVITYIEERLAELEEEKDELKDYQRLDQDKRACEYICVEKELQEVRDGLESIEQERIHEAQVSNDLHDAARAFHDQIRVLEQDLESKSLQFEQLEARRTEIEHERTETLKMQYQLELEVKELTDTIATDRETSEAVEAEIQHLLSEIQTVEDRLAVQAGHVERLDEAYKATMAALDELKQQHALLIAKQSHKTQFQSKRERDAFLTSECATLSDLIQQREFEKRALNEKLVQLRHSYEACVEQCKEYDFATVERNKAVQASTRAIQTLKQRRNDLSEDKKEKWRAEAECQKKLEAAKQKMLKGQDAMYAHDIRKALELIRELNHPGVFGPLIELIQPVDDRFCTVIDEAAGSSLFHVVVDTDETATRIMKELSKRHCGRLTFLPLNRLRTRNDEKYPENDANVFPLIQKLKYDQAIHKAVSATFGKKLICRDLSTCNHYAATWKMDCLTLNGDMVHRRGGLNGGYRDPSRSRTRLAEQVRAAKIEIETLTRDCEKATDAAEAADSEIGQILSELQQQENQKKRVLDTMRQGQSQYNGLMEQKKQTEANVQATERLIDEAECETQALLKKQAMFKQEMALPFQDTLTVEETKTLRQLSVSIQSKTKECVTQKQELETKKMELIQDQTLLQTNLKRRLDECYQKRGKESSEQESESLESSTEESLSALQSKQMDLTYATRVLEQSTVELHSIEEAAAELSKQVAALSSELEQTKARDVEHNRKIEREAQSAETLLNQRSRLVAKRTELMAQLREFGTIPSLCAELKHLTPSQLSQRINRNKRELNKYGHVNKKALDQYMNFNQQRTRLIDRKEELEHGYGSIKDLVQVLDQRKDEAILRTFKGVSHHFSQIFTELVPTGLGRMCIVRNEAAEDQPETETTTVETFRGIQIKVNFRGEGDAYLMQQLSGGQKALVALAFIFAIQRCDPAPFYLFDEIDQALDSTHRAAVAALIHRQATSSDNPAQFITSTFRPEMVQVCDKWYGIGHQHKISNVHTMTKDEALEFIATTLAEEERN